ncbi:MAG: hypothetical protein DBX55_03185 [Verrucomicrobia bacterium]|nr:MAG: hypothetical protein DBX55_03185 [Verrucomicrobiota bacterium]
MGKPGDCCEEAGRLLRRNRKVVAGKRSARGIEESSAERLKTSKGARASAFFSFCALRLRGERGAFATCQNAIKNVCAAGRFLRR